MKTIHFIVLLLSGLLISRVSYAQTYLEDPLFVRGADISFLPQIEDNGGLFRDSGRTGDAIGILHTRGVNMARLRLWHTAAEDYNGLSKTLGLAVRVHAAGMRILLDLHYSDTWADPGHQHVPPAWDSLSYETLRESVYVYTKDVVAAFASQGTVPSVVQIGNEISCGMLWNYGNVCGSYETETQWERFAGLLKDGIRGARDGAPGDSIRIMIHSDRGGDSSGAIWLFDHLLAENVSWDITGLSYYPWWHGPLSSLAGTLNSVAGRYGKEVMVVETAYPWTLAWNDATGNIVGSPDQLLPGYPQNSLGQQQFLEDVMELVHGTPGGRGVCYWEPDWISTPTYGSAWENLALFNFDGDALPAIGVFAWRTDVPYNAGWNLVSLPNVPPDNHVAAVFPGASTAAFAFDGTYFPGDTLAAGKGYWVRLTAGEILRFTGDPRIDSLVPLRQGWNLIGPFSCRVLVSSLASTPDGILDGPVFGYDMLYRRVDELLPGRGYWIKANSAGVLRLPCR